MGVPAERLMKISCERLRLTGVVAIDKRETQIDKPFGQGNGSSGSPSRVNSLRCSRVNSLHVFAILQLNSLTQGKICQSTYVNGLFSFNLKA